MTLEGKLQTTNLRDYIVEFYRLRWNIDDATKTDLIRRGFMPVSPADLSLIATESEIGKRYIRAICTRAKVLYDPEFDRVIVIPNIPYVLDGDHPLAGLDSLSVNHIERTSRANRNIRLNIVPRNRANAVRKAVKKMLVDGTAFTANYGYWEVKTSDFGIRGSLPYQLFSDKWLGSDANRFGKFLEDNGMKVAGFSFDCRGNVEKLGVPYWDALRVGASDRKYEVNCTSARDGLTKHTYWVLFKKK